MAIVKSLTVLDNYCVLHGIQKLLSFKIKNRSNGVSKKKLTETLKRFPLGSKSRPIGDIVILCSEKSYRASLVQ